MKQPFFRVNERVIVKPQRKENAHVDGFETYVTYVSGWTPGDDGAGTFMYRAYGLESPIQEEALKKLHFGCGHTFTEVMQSVGIEEPEA